MKNGSMFGMLKKYRADETLYNTSKYFLDPHTGKKITGMRSLQRIRLL